MEAAGLAIGILSLASLFDNCLELAEYISLAQNLGHDYETAYTKYLLVKARLCAWRPCVEVLEHPDQQGKWSEERMLVSRSLIAIKSLLQDGQELESRYGLRRAAQAEQWRQQQQQHTRLSESIIEIEHALTTSMRQRQHTASWRTKLRWAIRDKKAFETLIGNFSFHVNELEKLAGRMQTPGSDTIRESLGRVTSPAAVRLLEEAVTGPDIPHVGAGAGTDGHVFVRNQVGERARVAFGDVGVGDVGKEGSGRKHYYAGNQVVGNARVVMGNASVEFMAKFFEL